MKKFKGFSSGSASTIIPSSFFSELLPLIDDAAELKLTLFCMWALQQREGGYRFLRYEDFTSDDALMSGLSALDSAADPVALLDAALARAHERGTLLSGTVNMSGQSQVLIVVNTPQGRTLMDQIASGQWQIDPAGQVEILPERPNIYRLYEENIGPLSPHIASSIKDAEADYPAEWLIEAVQIAIENNARNWRYIKSILARWQEEGRHRAPVKKSNGQAGKQYVSGKYADYVKS